jgi:hypothetical protein
LLANLTIIFRGHCNKRHLHKDEMLSLGELGGDSWWNRSHDLLVKTERKKERTSAGRK